MAIFVPVDRIGTSTMTMARYLNIFLLTVAMAVGSVGPRLCKAQGNITCDTPRVCGPFGSCNSDNSPMCSCLRGFDPSSKQEWDSGNWSGGCVRRVPLNCESSNGGGPDGFLTLEGKLPNYTSRWSGLQNQCEGQCLGNCSCIAYGYDVGIGCMFWSGELMNLQEFSGGSTGTTTVHIRVSSSELESKKGNNSTIIIVVVVVVVVVVGVAVCLYFGWKWKAKRRRGEATPSEQPLQGASWSVVSSVQESFGQGNLEELPFFKFEVLANATDNFSEHNKLGKGGFGPVYKGVLVNGKEIAIKRLSKASGQGMQEFMNEVELISKLQHRNLVRLFGCCVENKENMLIYEYMPNKSLDFFLFDPSKEILDWRKRCNIMKGICRGLIYLHRDSRLKIIHRDLKPSNILLDNDWNPKISDFGMARIYETKQDHVSTVRVVGTYGYMAPEYAFEGRFSEKSDVFSFGILMLEIACGRRNTSFHHEGATMNLLGHVWKLWNEADIIYLIDSRISDPTNHSEVSRCIHIGLLCVQELPVDRPSISSVLSMLNSETIELPAPKQPAFVVTKPNRSTTGTSSSQMTSGSMNNVTLTVVDGR